MEKKSATNCIIVPPTVLAKLHINTAAAIKNIDTGNTQIELIE